LGELAIQQEDLDVAFPIYVELAKNFPDADIIERAVALALEKRDYTTVFDLTSQWLLLEPSSVRARELHALTAWLTKQKEAEGLMKEAFLSSAKPDGLFRQWVEYLDDFPAGVSGILSLESDTPISRYRMLARILSIRENLSSAQLALGGFAFKNNLYKEAETHALLAWKYGKHDDELAKVVSALLAKKPDEQERFWQNYLKESPNSIGARSMVGLSYLDEKDLLGAYQTLSPLPRLLEKASDENKDLWGALPTFALAFYFSQQARFVPAKVYFEKYISLIANAPNAKERLLFGEFALLKGALAQKNASEAVVLMKSLESQKPGVINDLKLEQLKIKALQEGGSPALTEVDKMIQDGRLSADMAKEIKLNLYHYLDLSELALTDLTQWMNAPDLEPEQEIALGREFAYFADKQLLSTEAINVLTRLNKKFPNNEGIMNDLGYILVNRSLNIKQAESLLKLAYKKDPKNPAIMDSLGWFFYRKGDKKQALNHLRLAHKITYNSEIALHLYVVLMANGLKIEANQVFDEVALETPQQLSRFKIIDEQVDTNQKIKKLSKNKSRKKK
jgi:uncharacterized protein HemY